MQLLSKLKNNLILFLSKILTSQKKRAVYAFKKALKHFYKSQKKLKLKLKHKLRLAIKKQIKYFKLKQRKSRKCSIINSKYSIIASSVLIFFALLSYNLPEKYQLTNLIKSDNTKIDEKNQDTTKHIPAKLTSTSGQALVLAEVTINNKTDQIENQNKKTIQLSGVLTDKDGRPAEGTYITRFAIYTKNRNALDPYPSNTDQSQRIWEETQEITFENGIFQVELGEKTDLPIITENSNQLFIGMRINTDSEMVPRKKISTPLFAFNSGNAITLNGKRIGIESGDIPILNESGKININNLPIGNGTDQLVTSNDSRLNGSLTISGAKYLTISKQKITLKKINLSSDTQGTLDLYQGGTGLANYTKGDLPYYTEGDTLTKLPIGSENQILSVINGTPVWQNSQATTYTKSGTLLQLIGNNFSIKEGTLTNTKLCTYDTTAGLVCDTSTSSIGHAPVTINLISNGMSIDGSQVISLTLSSATTTGALNSTDWNIFNSKQPAGSYLTSYTETDPIYNASQAKNITSSHITILGNTSNTNSGDNAVNTLYSGLASSKQDTLNGTGFIKISGTTISYDNSVYITGTPWTGMGYLTSYTETDPTISAWAKAGTKPNYTATEIGLSNVPNLTFSGNNTGDETTNSIKTKLGSASTTLDGYLTTTDWNIFNNKQPAGSYLTSYTETDPSYNASQAKNITSSHITILGNTSNTNSGDNAVNTLYSGLASSKQDTLINPITGTGAINYLSKFTSSGAIGNSLIFDNGTNVGIGTTSPNFKFDVQGTGTAGQINAAGGLCIAGVCKTAWTDSGIGSSVWTISGNNIYNSNTGNIGIGTTSPISKFEVAGLATMTGTPTGTGVSGGALYINPSSYSSASTSVALKIE